MKTDNYKFDLMYQGQEHKNVIYNETILKIDAMMNLSVINLLEQVPNNISFGERYILKSGEHKNKICYFAHNSKGIQYIEPYNNMLIYLVAESCFMIFHRDEWKVIGSNNNCLSTKQQFVLIENKYILPEENNYHYLYLNGHTEIDFSQVNSASFVLIIKQNYQQIYEITWPSTILWSDKIPIQITSSINSIDFFRFFKLPESYHFIAEIVKQDYQY